MADLIGVDVAQSSRPCQGCGEPIYRTTPAGPIAHFHGPECRPRCVVDGCEKPQHAHQFCSAHATRSARLGDPLAPLQRQPNVGACSVEGCEQPSRKRTWCAAHYAQWTQTGRVKPFGYRWAPTGGVCVVCGTPVPANSGRRKHCSDACQAADSNHKGARPHSFICASCGRTCSLGRDNAGRLVRSDSKLCRPCRKRKRHGGLRPAQIAARDGAFCRICGCDVDLLARKPDPMRPSIDHIVPRALGGTDGAANLQLAHLHCNQLKADKAGFVLLP